jgi:hypothetical protein
MVGHPREEERVAGQPNTEGYGSQARRSAALKLSMFLLGICTASNSCMGKIGVKPSLFIKKEDGNVKFKEQNT